MKKDKISLIILLLSVSGIIRINAQTADQVTSTSDLVAAQSAADRTIYYSLSDTGEYKPITWGLDLAWLDEANIRRGVAFMGMENVDVVRASFQPTYPLVDGDLQQDQINDLNARLSIINSRTGPDTKVMLNCDHKWVDAWYLGNAAHWAQLIDMTTRRVQDAGRTVVAVAPFNEPDYGWGQYEGNNGMSDFYNICGELRNNPRFDSIRISGGNTLNTDQALPWYNYLKGRLEEGNTHQLAGSFDNYASFHETVKANGDHGTNDELHNVMEAMVGVEYGMQTGIWWGWAELARGEFVKASDGRRLGYAEHRPNWTAASVYRDPDGKVQAFGGTSERQAVTTTYRFVSLERAVFYDGYGPQRDYTMVMPGGTGYQQGQTNAERVVNITWGDDIQPAISGRYILVNRNSGKVIEVANGSMDAGANVQQNTNIGAIYQQWNVTPVDPRIGGDFSYFTFTAAHSGKAVDILNWSLDDGANIIVWNDAKGANQQWYLEYAEDGWFYIRSRHSAKCLTVYNASTADGSNIYQWKKTGDKHQQWRFLPVGATVEFDAPSAPENLVATARAESVRLDWSANSEEDVTGYTVFRSESAGGPYNTVARDVVTTAFVDNTTTTDGTYFYRIRAVDNALNRSEYSEEVSAVVTGYNSHVLLLRFEGNTLDSSVNLNHCVQYGDISYVEGQVGSEAIALNGTDAFVQLPIPMLKQEEMTIAMWVYWMGGSKGQRVFDFGFGDSESMFLETISEADSVRFTFRKDQADQYLDAPRVPYKNWQHIAITIGEDYVRYFADGNLKSETNDISLRPADINTFFNYIGRGQGDERYFRGYIDDFRVYNYALSENEIAQIYTSGVTSIDEADADGKFGQSLSLWPVPANEILYVNYSSGYHNGPSTLEVMDMNGRPVIRKDIRMTTGTELNVSDLPAGIYLLRVVTGQGSIVRKLIIKH